MVWGISVETWELWGVRFLIGGALAGVGGLVLSAISAYLLYTVAANDAGRLKLELENAKNAAKQLDANLLREQRLTSSERVRLRHLERAVLPRSQFVDWDGLVTDLQNSGIEPFNLATIQWPPEAVIFGRTLGAALQRAHVLKREIEIPFVPKVTVGSSSGSIVVVGSVEGQKQAEQVNGILSKYGIAGGLMGRRLLPSEWSQIPENETTLLVIESGRWMAIPDGQAGEGRDDHGRAVPPK